MSKSKVEEYLNAIRACMLAADSLAKLDLPAMLEVIERADALGPILDPTLWSAKYRAMHVDRELLRAALPLWELVQKMLEARGEEGQG